MKYFLLGTSLLLSSFVYGGDFSSVVNEISANLNSVTTKSDQIAQSISEVSPGVVEYSITTTNIKNGKSELHTFIFNFADIDINTVRAISDKDVIQVQLLVRNEQDLIKETVDHTKQSYTDAVFIQSSDINNGRILVDLIKSAIPLAIDITEKRLSLVTYEDHLNWLLNTVGDVSLGENQFSQKFESNPKYPGSLIFTLTEASSKSTKTSVYAFNAMNLNPNAILFKISGDVFSIEIETARKLDLIKPTIDAEQKSYTNSFEIICGSVEQARDIQKVLKEFTALSQTEFEKLIPNFTSIGQAVSTVNDLINTVVVNDVTFTQRFEDGCISTFSKNEASSKEQVSEQYHFNFADLNQNIVSYETKGNLLFLELQTLGSADYIKHIVDKEQKNYTNSMQVVCAEVEAAILLQAAFKYIIGHCTEKSVNYADKSKTELLDLIFNGVKPVALDGLTFNQSIAKGTAENGLVFKMIEVSEKSSREKLYEFNYTDINASSIKMETSRKRAYVILNTNFNEKIIQYYEDGAIKNYQNTIEIEADNIENARMLVALFKELTKE